MNTDIPEGWERVDFSKVTYVKGKSQSSYRPGRFVYLTPEYLREKTKPVMISEFPDCVFTNEDETILLWDGSNAGEVFRSRKGILASTMVKFVLNVHDFDSCFLYFSLKLHEEKIKSERRGSGIPHVDKSTLSKLSYVKPKSISEQRRIAAILQSVDNAIDKTKEVIEKHKKMKQGLMQDLFEADETWISTTAGELLQEGTFSEIQDGNHGELHPKSSDFVDEGIPFVMANDIIDGKIDLEHCHRISEKQYLKLRIGFSKPEDVLLTHKGTVGRTCIVPPKLTKIMLTPQVTYYRLRDKNKLDNEYLLHFFNSDRFQKQIQALSAQSTRNYIGILEQKKLTIEMPCDIREQRRIVTILTSASSKICSEVEYLNKLIKIKAGLMQDLLTGKVRVAA